MSSTPEGPTPGDPTEPTQEAPPADAPPPPRRLTRSRSDRVLAGVSGGLARYFGADPVLFRLGFVVGLLFGGASAVLYLAAILLVPEEGTAEAGAGTAPAGTAPAAERNKWLVGLGIVALVVVGGPIVVGLAFAAGGILIPLGLLVLLALGIAWAVTGRSPAGRDPADIARLTFVGLGVLVLLFVLATGSFWGAAAGGDVVVASLVVLAGLVLVASAFARPARWLILPAFALALPAAFVAAAGVSFEGGYGEERYRPSQVADIRDEYRLGVGSLTVDLRDVELPPGDHRIKLDVGMGEAVLLVPEDACVASTAEIGMGGVDVLTGDTGGIDVDWEDLPEARAGAPRIVVDTEIGLGGFAVEHDEVARELRWGSDDGDRGTTEAAYDGCA